jgi:hypothetical protein
VSTIRPQFRQYQMVMVVGDPILVPGRPTSRLDAPDDAFLGERSKRVRLGRRLPSSIAPEPSAILESFHSWNRSDDEARVGAAVAE